MTVATFTSTSEVSARWTLTTGGPVAFDAAPEISGTVAEGETLTLADAVTYDAAAAVVSNSVVAATAQVIPPVGAGQRIMSGDMLSAIQEEEVTIALAFEAEFESGTVRFWTGTKTRSWNGFLWQGFGDLIGISAIVESKETVASGLSVSLSGINPALVSAAIQESRQGATGKVWLALLDTAGNFIADPVLAFVGRLDVPTIADSGETCTISITYENRLVDLKRARNLRYTHEAQQSLFPGDKGFEYVAAIQDYQVTWGR